MPQIEADLISTISGFSRAGDLNNLTFFAHAERVAYISFQLGQELQLTTAHLQELIQSALLHDIGITTTAEQLDLADPEPSHHATSPHCRRGYKLLLPTKLFGPFALNVLEHHHHYSLELRLIPAIIHVADRLDLILDKNRYYLWQIEDVLNYFQSKQGSIFHPDVIEALSSLATVPSFWFDLQHGNYREFEQGHKFQRILTLDELEEIAQLMATLVDSKSPFTADHSQSLAKMVVFLGAKLGLPEYKSRLLKIAALLHDIGKLAIPDEILMHPGALNKQQRAMMKQHTYHTYHLIGSIGPGVKELQAWSAYHHERLDGTGYPFALSAEDLDLEARLVAVADITQSLLETRPYRAAFPKEKVIQILRNNVQAKHIDAQLTDLIISHLDEIIEIPQPVSS